MIPAKYSRSTDNEKVQCLLCPHMCILKEGQAGNCKVRKNISSQLVSETYGNVAAINYDPVEKKPLYHFYPGSIILSLGSVGCNLDCSFCQNCEISQSSVADHHWFRNYDPEQIVDMARDKPANAGIAFTYNEPTVYYEYMLDIAQLAKKRGLKTVMVSNGYINPEPLLELIPFIDAYNIDLKAFDDDFYKRQTKSSLAPVLSTLKILRDHEKHLEITNLVVPGLNDDPLVFSSMLDWIISELGNFTILHLSRYFPHHKMKKDPTPTGTLIKLFNLAREKLKYVYLGNMAHHDGQHTYCPDCHSLLISRNRYQVKKEGISNQGKCLACGSTIKNIQL